LIIFSDGHEYVFHGITIDEAEIRIRDSRVPIYTVATLGRNPPNRYVESAKILGSFARLSAGGRHYVHNLDRAVSEEIVADITESIQNSLIVTVGLEGFRSDGEDLMLRLDLDFPGVGRAGDGYPISTVGLTMPEPTPSPEPEPTPESVPDPTPAPVPATPPISESEQEPEPEMEKSFFQENTALLIIGGVVLLLAIGFVLFLIKRKKPDETQATQSGPEPVAPMPVTMGPAVRPGPAPPAPPPGKPRISLRLTKIGLVEEQVFRTEFAGELVIGRDPGKSSLPFVNDDMLSGRHCSVSYEPDGIVLRDLGSTNKTYVNGVPITDKYILENDDVLLIGSMELRVNWETLT
jgi:LPXTG-motif cell wall-anchored protein